jgi:hypothetical protein
MPGRIDLLGTESDGRDLARAAGERCVQIHADGFECVGRDAEAVRGFEPVRFGIPVHILPVHAHIEARGLEVTVRQASGLESLTHGGSDFGVVDACCDSRFGVVFNRDRETRERRP